MNERGMKLLQQAGLTQAELGQSLGVTQSAVSRKLSGERAWSQRDVGAVLVLLSRRLGRKVTYEMVFGSPFAGRKSA